MHGYSFNKMQAKALKRGVETETYQAYVKEHAETKKERQRKEKERQRESDNKR